MSSVSAEEIEQILGTIEKALQMHTKWYEDLVRRLLCKLPLPDSVVAKNAHQHCDFGCWFYGNINERSHGLPAFAEIGELHKIMHDSARELYLKMKATGMVHEDDYDYFTRNVSRFKGELAEFRQRVLNTLNHVSTK